MTRSVQAAALLAVLLLNAGCDDPTGVGIGLIDNRSGEPQIEETVPSLTPAVTVRDVTGNARRALLGAVDDPLLGGTRASAALDFALPATLIPSSAFQGGPVSEAQLRLVRDYRYGDTTATADFSISEIVEEWSATGNNSGADIPAGPNLATVSLSASDTLLTIDLPKSWVDANDEDLRSQDFISLFDGFFVEPLSGGAVLGIDVDESSMRVVSGGDTLDFLVSRNLSLVSRTSPGNPPAGTVVLQDGPSAGLGIDLDLDGADLANLAVARVVVRVPYDSLAFRDQLPADFVRPALTRVDLVGLTADSIAIPLATSQVRDGSLVFDDLVLLSTIQSVVIDQSIFESFALMGTLDLSPVENTASGLLLRDGTDGGDGPEMVLTVIKPAEL